MSKSLRKCQDGRDALDLLSLDLFGDNDIGLVRPTRRKNAEINYRLDSTLVELISERVKMKAVPLAMRKRLMYERALAS